MEIPIKPKDIRVGMLIKMYSEDRTEYGVITKIDGDMEYKYKFWGKWYRSKKEEETEPFMFYGVDEDESWDGESYTAFVVTKINQTKLI